MKLINISPKWQKVLVVLLTISGLGRTKIGKSFVLCCQDVRILCGGTPHYLLKVRQTEIWIWLEN